MGKPNTPIIFAPFFAGIVFIFLSWYFTTYPESFEFISLDHNILSILFFIGGVIALLFGFYIIFSMRRHKQ